MAALQSTVLFVVGSLTFVVGVVTIIAPNTVERANERVFPGIETSSDRWRGIGLMAIGIGTLLVLSA